MATQAQVLANQANALKSTGPKTEEGKKKASLNAWRHGLTGQAVVMPHEDMMAYLEFRKELEAELAPVGALETQIVRRVIDTQWRLNRCFSLENALYCLGHSESPGDVPCSDARIHAVMTAARVLRDQNATIQTLGMHEQRLTRIYDRAMAELQRLQSQRKSQRLQQLNEAALIRNHKETLKQPWEPAENGFAFSIPELDRYIDLQKTLAAASYAFAHGAEQDRRMS